MPTVPTPAAAKYSAAGEPSPPAPRHNTLALQQFELALGPHLGQQQVAVVAVALVGREGHWQGPIPALVLPAVEPAVHGHHIAIAHFLEGLSGERRAHPTRAHDHHRGILVGQAVLHVGLEIAPRDVDRAGHCPLLKLVGLPHVKQSPLLRPTSLQLRRGRSLGSQLWLLSAGL